VIDTDDDPAVVVAGDGDGDVDLVSATAFDVERRDLGH
jgi:hypothetical protein